MKINKLIAKIENCDDILSAVKCDREELVEKLKEKLARVGLGVVELDFGKDAVNDKECEWIDWWELQPGDVVAFERSVVDGEYAEITKDNKYTIDEIEENGYARNVPIRITMDDNEVMKWVDIQQVERVKLINRP